MLGGSVTGRGRLMTQGDATSRSVVRERPTYVEGSGASVKGRRGGRGAGVYGVGGKAPILNDGVCGVTSGVVGGWDGRAPVT